MTAPTTATRGGQVEYAAPRPSGRARTLGVVLSVVLLGLAAVLLHDALVAAGALTTGWVAGAADALGAVRPGAAATAAGAVLVLVGIVLVVAALTRGARTSRPFAGRAGLYLDDRDVARLSSATAQTVPGVLDAVSTATRRRVEVTVRTTGGPGTPEQVTDRVRQRLAVLASPPAVAVRTRGARR